MGGTISLFSSDYCSVIARDKICESNEFKLLFLKKSSVLFDSRVESRLIVTTLKYHLTP